MSIDTDELLERVLSQVTAYVGSGGGGSYSFQILCSCPACYRQDSISASRITFTSEKHKRKAAEKFVARRWTFEKGPICPDCRKERSESKSASGEV
jgi:hypothetical protein